MSPDIAMDSSGLKEQNAFIRMVTQLNAELTNLGIAFSNTTYLTIGSHFFKKIIDIIIINLLEKP